MPKDLPAQIITQIDAEQSRPVLLFELGLNAGTLRFAATKANIVFPTGGNTYTAKAVEMGNIEQRAEGQIVRATIRFDNAIGDMAGYADAERFDGKSIVIKKVYRDALGNASYHIELLNGYIEEAEAIGRHWLEINAIQGKSLQRQTLLDLYQKRCNRIFGDAQCNKDGHANLASLKATGTADSGTASTLVDSALVQADDYWNFGRIEIVYDGDTHYRKVKDFVAGTDTVTFDVPLPFAVDDTCTYTIYKGCSNTWDACQSLKAWGPGSDNKANFFGFIHIGESS